MLRRATAAVPVLPPDPLQVLDLQHEEGENPEEDRGPRHPRTVAEERAARNGPPDSFVEARVAYRRAPDRPKPPVNRLISQIRATIAAITNSQCTTKPALNKMTARIANTISNSISPLLLFARMGLVFGFGSENDEGPDGLWRNSPYIESRLVAAVELAEKRAIVKQYETNQ